MGGRPCGSRCRTGRPTRPTWTARWRRSCAAPQNDRVDAQPTTVAQDSKGRPDRRPRTVDQGSAQTSLIGRERERAQLQAWTSEALAGRGSLVLLAGEAGVGKTTLARAAPAGSGLDLLEGFGVQGGADEFGPIVEVLRSRLRGRRGGPLVEGPLAAHLALLLPEL